MGKEHHVSLSRPGESPFQWIQLLRALDQQELPGWPLVTVTVQMQKCDKCSREFCSLINYRRHIRVHRRSRNIDKESHNIRDMLAAFWDKLSVEEAKEVVSLRDVMLKDISGALVIKEWATSICNPEVWTLPQAYVKAGSSLLDVINAKPSRLPISSQELLCILDDASEGTFLCAGTAESVRNYVFDGEVLKAAQNLKNLVACLSFLFEQNLVKAWLADKDAEALRCQKLLMEEEEAAKQRQAELLKRRKQKKLRLKELKAREQFNGEKSVLDVSPDSLQEIALAKLVRHLAPSDSNFDDAPDTPAVVSLLEPFHFANNENYVNIEAQTDIRSNSLHSCTVQNVDTSAVSLNVCRWQQVPSAQTDGRNGFHDIQNLEVLKLEALQNQVSPRDQGGTENNCEVWTKKFDESFRQKVHGGDENKCELMIGSIPIPVEDRMLWKKNLHLRTAPNGNSSGLGKQENHNDMGKQANFDNSEADANQAVSKHLRPVSRSETRAQPPAQSGNQDCEEEVIHEMLADQTSPDGSCLQSSALDNDHQKSLPSLGEAPAQSQGLVFSSVAVKAFLADRWKKAITEDHVTLVLSPEPGLAGGTQPQISSVSGDAKANITTNSKNGVNYVPKKEVAA